MSFHVFSVVKVKIMVVYKLTNYKITLYFKLLQRYVYKYINYIKLQIMVIVNKQIFFVYLTLMFKYYYYSIM